MHSRSTICSRRRPDLTAVPEYRCVLPLCTEDTDRVTERYTPAAATETSAAAAAAF
eukprot:COSAG05_NODE_3768_length_1847_cov_1.592677_2_plen_55_part_01